MTTKEVQVALENECKQSERRRKKKYLHGWGADRGAKCKQCRDNTAPEYLEKLLARRKKQRKEKKNLQALMQAGGGSGTQTQREGNERSGPWKKIQSQHKGMLKL